MASEAGWLRRSEHDGGDLVTAGGAWVIAYADKLDREAQRLAAGVHGRLTIDLASVDRLDTAGAWLLFRTLGRLRADGAEVAVTGARAEHEAMLDHVARNFQPCEIEPSRPNTVLRVLHEVGVATVAACQTGAGFLSFLGEASVVSLRAVVRPGRVRFTSTIFHIEQVGFNALPIVGLISFLIGVVLAYQGAEQLQRFGAQVFVVDLVAISVLREIGILLTAIVVAGRSGSAFTAQIGSMVVNQEVDAMRALGLDPMEILVLPRVLALIIAMPLLAFYADIMGLLGGGLMSWIVLDVNPGVFLIRLKESVSIWSFWVGIIKAPVFAALIALVGCFEGLKVVGSAESVGAQTTRSVVEAIFLVIIADAIFSIFFSFIGI